ncbi:MAG: histidine phosphatase family protein [Oscillospiraceae bacterium]|nr:histidine phosphatase family protein [Oscillospiraceae bacterium]
MKTKFYLVRHGQSQGNLLGLFLGHTDMDLTELGYRQAELAAEYLKDIPVDVIYASDLQRAYHTGCPTAEAKGMEIHKSAALREVYAGLWEERAFDDLMVEYPESYGKVWRLDIGNAQCDSGESVMDLQKRIVTELQRIAEENPGKSVMIFTHATPIRVFAAHCRELSADQIKDIPWASNASVTTAEYEDGKFTLLEYSIDHFMGELVTSLGKNV